MSNILFQISAHKKIGEFIKWAAGVGHSFNYNIFRRTKDGIGKRTTDRQKLLIEVAALYWEQEVEFQRVFEGQEG
jgi:hypothetical protein